MKHIKYTYVDALTGISIASQPAANGPVPPPVVGLQFVWARESAYPTDVPEFFGLCAGNANTQVDGVLGVYLQSDWEQMRADEMAARDPVPVSISPRQIRQALTRAGLRSAVEAAVASGDQDLKDWYEFSAEFERANPQVQAMGAALGVDAAALDGLWQLGAAL